MKEERKEDFTGGGEVASGEIAGKASNDVKVQSAMTWKTADGYEFENKNFAELHAKTLQDKTITAKKDGKRRS